MGTLRASAILASSSTVKEVNPHSRRERAAWESRILGEREDCDSPARAISARTFPATRWLIGSNDMRVVLYAIRIDAQPRHAAHIRCVARCEYDLTRYSSAQRVKYLT